MEDAKPFAECKKYMVTVQIKMPRFTVGCHRYRCNQCRTFFRRSKGNNKALFCGRSCAFAFQSQWHGKRRSPKQVKEREPRQSEEERKAKNRAFAKQYYQRTFKPKKELRTSCMMCNASVEGRSHRVKYCSYACCRKAEKKRNKEYYRYSKRVENKKRGDAAIGCERFLSIEIFERDKWTCQICGKKVNKDLKVPHRMAPTLDHILPISAGGLHTRQNVRLAHLSCNCSRGHKGYAQGLLYG